MVRELYLAAELSLNADLDRLARAPRVANDPAATDYYLVPGRTPSGRIGLPVLRVHETGDAYVPPAVIESYRDQIRLHRREALYRDAILDRAGHTTLSATEVAVVVGALRQRITDGALGESSAADLNAAGDRLRPGESTFVAYQPPRANGSRYLS